MTDQLARGQRSGVPEVTEYFNAGQHRVTRCESGNRPSISVTATRIPVPGGGTVLVPTEIVRTDGPHSFAKSILYGLPGDPVWEKQWRAERESAKALVLPPTRPTTSVVGAAKRGASAAQLYNGDECTNSAHTQHSWHWPSRTYTYYMDASTIPGTVGLDSDAAPAIIKGHENWDQTNNNCDIDDQPNFDSRFSQAVQAGFDNGDGLNGIDFGDMAETGCGGGSIACTSVGFNTQTGEAFEGDQRYNEDILWSTNGARRFMDLEGVATHQSGHMLGVFIQTSSVYLTMYSYVGRFRSTWLRTLGYGDILGMREKYPG